MTVSTNINILPAGELLNYSSSTADSSVTQRLAGFMNGRGGTYINTGSGDDEVYIGGNISGDTQEAEGGESQEKVAAYEHGRIWSDPHFEGGDGGRYDVQGEAGKTYNLLSDTGLQFNGQFDRYTADSSEGTAIGQTGLTVTGNDGQTSQIGFIKDGTATLDGQAMQEGKEYTLADGGTAKLNGNTLTVKTGEGYTIKQKVDSYNGESYINTDVNTGADGVDNGSMPGGLLGQTFDADDVARNGNTGHGAQGEGAIEGVVGDYETDGLFGNSQNTELVTGSIAIDTGSGDDTVAINEPVSGPINIDTGSGDDVVIIGGETPPSASTPIPEDPVAANEQGRIWGDPHFVGGDGGKYDVQGEAGKIYDLLSDSGLDLRGQFDGWGSGVTVVGETGLTVGEGLNSDNINFSKDGSARINGSLMEQGQAYDLADGGTAKLENGTLTVTTAEGYTIEQKSHGSGDRAYINIDVSTGENGVGNGQMPGGLLGQTFDADDVARNGKTGKGAQGEGAIEGDVGDYECAALDPINDDSGAAGTNGSEFQELMTKIQEMLQELMDLLEQISTGNLSQEGTSALETHTHTGSGDDVVKIIADGSHTVELGSGDDDVVVDFEDGQATIDGGSGDDTVTLAGSELDYTVTEEDGYTVYTDADGNSVKVANDVETVRFQSEAA